MELWTYLKNYLGLSGVEAFGAIAPFGNGPTAAVTRADIESELRARGYTKSITVTKTVPKYTKGEAIRMAVDSALAAYRLPARPSVPMTIKAATWEAIIRVALTKANALLKETVTREVAVPESEHPRGALPESEHPRGLVL